MKKADALAVLTVLEQYQYVPNKEIAVMSWAEALDDDLPPQLAVATINRYYGQKHAASLPKMTPGDLNAAWAETKTREANRRQKALGGAPAGVPMPEWFKAAMMDAFGTTDLSGATSEAGKTKKSGAEVQAIFDSAAATAGIDLPSLRGER